MSHPVEVSTDPQQDGGLLPQLQHPTLGAGPVARDRAGREDAVHTVADIDVADGWTVTVRSRTAPPPGLDHAVAAALGGRRHLARHEVVSAGPRPRHSGGSRART